MASKKSNFLKNMTAENELNNDNSRARVDRKLPRPQPYAKVYRHLRSAESRGNTHKYILQTEQVGFMLRIRMCTHISIHSWNN